MSNYEKKRIEELKSRGQQTLKLILERLAQIEKLVKENRETSAAIFAVVIITGVISLVADISTIFGGGQMDVKDLDGSDFVAEFFMYENYNDTPKVSVNLLPSEDGLNIGSVKYGGSCDKERLENAEKNDPIFMDWYPVDVTGECIWESGTFYLKIFSRDGQASDILEYPINFPAQIKEYKKSQLKPVSKWVTYKLGYNDQRQLIIAFYIDEISDLIEEIHLGRTSEALNSIVKYSYEQMKSQTIISAGDLGLKQEGESSSGYFYKMNIEPVSIFAKLKYNDDTFSNIYEVKLEN